MDVCVVKRRLWTVSGMKGRKRTITEQKWIKGENPGISRRKKNGGSGIFRSRPDRPWGPPSLLYNGCRDSFPGVKRPGRGVDHPPSSSARVKERVELYLYSPSGPSWPVIGRTLPYMERIRSSPVSCFQ
jgi:hypothetical protein